MVVTDCKDLNNIIFASAPDTLMVQYPKLSSTPIKEIIFTISYSDVVSVAVLNAFCNDDRIKQKFSFVQESFESHSKSSDSAETETSVSNDGSTLRCKKENKAIQIRKGSISLHKVNQYEDFDALLPELLNYWDILVSCAGEKLSINNLSLRYLNLIDLHEGEYVADIITIEPKNPFVENLDNFFMQLKFEIEETAITYINLIATVTENSNKQKSVILDILSNQKHTELLQSEDIGKFFTEMRNVKNDVFFRSITENTIQRYSSHE